MNINFTDTTIQAALIGVIGALIAGFGAAYLTVLFTNRKEKKKESEKIKSLKDAIIIMLKINITQGLERIKTDCDNLIPIIESKNMSVFQTSDITFLNNSILELFKLEDLIKICNTYNIPFERIVDLNTKLTAVKYNTPLNIIKEYTYEINSISQHSSSKIKELHSSQRERINQVLEYDDQRMVLQQTSTIKKIVGCRSDCVNSITLIKELTS